MPNEQITILKNGFVIPKPKFTVKWNEFNAETYLSKNRYKEGEDQYSANKFNQAASDAVSFNRSIIDSRESKF